MAGFQQNLCDFFTECKNDALVELGDHKAYSDWKHKSAELYSFLIAHMPKECIEPFKLYLESLSAMSGIEADYCYLCGIRDYLGIGKQFDTKTEWGDLVSHILPKSE